MPTRPEPINAIAYAQFQLRGGFKGLALIMLGAALLVALMGTVMVTSDPQRTQKVAEGAIQSLLAIQWLLLTLFGGSRVAAAVRSDMTSGLIESHRLAPTPPLAAVAGYVLAAPLQAIAVALVLLPYGVAASVVAHVPVSIWLVGNVMAFAAAVMVWSLAALITFASRQAGTPVAVGAIAGALSSILIVVPAVGVIASPVVGQTLWLLRRTDAFRPAYFLTLTANALLSGVFILAAARRYRSVVTDAFNVPLGLLLLAIWSAITITGLALPDTIWGRGMGLPADVPTMLLAGLGSTVLVALLPVAALARGAVAPREMRNPRRRQSAALLLLVAFPLCVLLAWSPATVMYTEPIANVDGRQWQTAAVIAITLLAAAFWIAAADLRGRTGWLPTIVWLALTNVGPVIVAAVLRGDADHLPLSPQITTLSPAASLVTLWTNDRDLPHVPRGVALQAALLLLPLSFFLYRLYRGRPGERLPTIDNPPPAAAE